MSEAYDQLTIAVLFVLIAQGEKGWQRMLSYLLSMMFTILAVLTGLEITT